MFAKDIKIRSNNQIKSSEKKNLIKEIVKQYPKVNEEELKNIIKVKDSEIVLSKIVTHASDDLIVYFIDKIPYFFRYEKDDQLFPTVYFLWKFPNILSKFYTHKEVFLKLVNGADLMLPGVIVTGELNLYTFKHIQKNQLCAICIRGNEAPVAIGRANLSGEDMYMSAMRGKCLNLIHCYQDFLWAQGDKNIQPPLISITSPVSTEANIEVKGMNSEEGLAQNIKTENEVEILADEKLDENLENLKLDQDQESQKGSENQEVQSNLIDHEQILTDSFLSTCKFKSKDIKFPLIVSTFMKIMQSCCPPDVQFDLKQTRFKKISVFLKEMEKKGCIKMKDQKGVLSITDINKENDLIKYFKKPDWLKQKSEQESQEEIKSIFEVIELYKIDGSNEELFKGTFKRGDILTSTEIRQYIMGYIKDHNLQDTQNPKFVNVDDLLNKIFVKNKQIENIKFDELFGIVFSKMGQMHQIKKVYSDKIEREQNLIIKKGKFQPIEFKLESRGGNKKVTNVYNLFEFDLDPNSLQSILRKEIGCSVSINEPVGSSQTSEFILSIQGNQIHQVSELLKNEFGIQLKHMNGLEQAIKP